MAMRIEESGEAAAARRAGAKLTTQDRLAYGGIVGAALVCMALLSWGHLGLGALLFPPKATAAVQTARAGDLTVALRLDSGQLTAAGPNDVSLAVTDARGRPVAGVAGAAVVVQPQMLDMAMDAPVVTAAPHDGVYVAHPKFAMAGDWRLMVTVTTSGQPPRQAALTVGVHWS